MAEEFLDVVNDRDEVVGRESRRAIHERGLRHRAVHVIIRNGAGLVFLQKRSIWKDTFPGAWDSSASGHVDPGEAYVDCAIRELREELGIELDPPPTPLFKLPACEETGQEFVWVYAGSSEGPFELPPAEIETGDWFRPSTIHDWLLRRPEELAGGFRLLWPLWESAMSRIP